MTTVKRSEPGYAQLLRDQFSLLNDSVGGFYRGVPAKAIEIAIRIRTLVHESAGRPGQVPSRALLSFLNPNFAKLSIFHKVPEHLSSPERSIAFSINQSFRMVPGQTPQFIREDFSSPSYVLVPLERWWNEEYLALGAVRSSKKQIILDTANTDGGAHVAERVPIRHAIASEPPFVFGVDDRFARPNLARATVAQAGNELLDYLEAHFRPILEDLLPPPTVEAVKRAAARFGFRAISSTDPVRTLFSRGNNFLNVHSDGKWAFYEELHDGKSPDHWGHDFKSLITFFHSRSPEAP